MTVADVVVAVVAVLWLPNMEVAGYDLLGLNYCLLHQAHGRVSWGGSLGLW